MTELEFRQVMARYEEFMLKCQDFVEKEGNNPEYAGDVEHAKRSITVVMAILSVKDIAIENKFWETAPPEFMEYISKATEALDFITENVLDKALNS